MSNTTSRNKVVKYSKIYKPIKRSVQRYSNAVSVTRTQTLSFYLLYSFNNYYVKNIHIIAEYNKCSAVAEMGDCLATIDMGQKLGGSAPVLGTGSWVPI